MCEGCMRVSEEGVEGNYVRGYLGVRDACDSPGSKGTKNACVPLDDQLCSTCRQPVSPYRVYKTCINYYSTHVLTTLLQLHTPVYVISNPPRPGTLTRALK